AVRSNPNPLVPLLPGFGDDPTLGINPDFHPMKGPMVTQSLRGMANHGPMHWRGDRTGGAAAASAQPDAGAFDERAAFAAFNPAFVSLLGRDAELPAAQMQAFGEFVLQIKYPPNPIRNLDSSLTPAQQAGRDFFFNVSVGPFGPCGACHVTDPTANPDAGSFSGLFGTDGRSAFANQPQILKVPHLRNLYQKVGMFGFGAQRGNQPADPFLGDQIRGFGFTHDGTVPDLFRFSGDFDQTPGLPFGIPPGPEGVTAKQNLEQFMLAFDTNLAPIVGQQITLIAGLRPEVLTRIDLLLARAEAGECEVVAKGRIGGDVVGFRYAGGGRFQPDRKARPLINDQTLRKQVALSGGELTYTCVPLGSGVRIGIDRDLDGVLDGDELAAGSDPADPASVP
ncbi:MAG TPA: hypothetical protein VK607_17735, partial [Kofleriaceae bacterium]|nr:hypothetical protein [Kofleriaceae bacterium]